MKNFAWLALALFGACSPDPISVTARDEKFVVARNRTGHCAIRFFGDERTSNISHYESYYQPDGSGDFSRPNVIQTLGHVSFDIIADPDPNAGPNAGKFVGEPLAFCGPLQIEWSSGDHLYLVGPFGKRADFELAETTWVRLGDISVSDSRLTWVGPRTHCLCASAFAAY